MQAFAILTGNTPVYFTESSLARFDKFITDTPSLAPKKISSLTICAYESMSKLEDEPTDPRVYVERLVEQRVGMQSLWARSVLGRRTLEAVLGRLPGLAEVNTFHDNFRGKWNPERISLNPVCSASSVMTTCFPGDSYCTTQRGVGSNAEKLRLHHRVSTSTKRVRNGEPLPVLIQRSPGLTLPRAQTSHNLDTLPRVGI
ncbi:hypothetical protein K458DRAFT_18297 [Lentithecium fluviatile CBS 122367]|uniref:Uncharacterized protein n=1 Tax=Lentithecium fluviatile CBS 122367 TaxID=1168545 RepID=A0A6G1J6T4_9PLEO|nr:hypothetical protein K458DRAFT_18297 [Lentithecium fluviatile CBS 122367]